MWSTNYRNLLSAFMLLFMSAFSLLACGSKPAAPQLPEGAPVAPSQTTKLIFIHHSCGSNWLSDSNGGLGQALRDHNYFVSDTNYGWGPDGIGNQTDIGHWWTWFNRPSSATYTQALYGESEQHSSYSRLSTDPGGENRVIMFKPCYPNSNIGGSPNETPTTGTNPLRDQGSGSSHMTVGNAKGIYADLLTYFAAHQDKLFVAITAPPLAAGSTDAARAANARAFNDWLVNDWLDGYPHNNVAVFDFYNVLTSNGGGSSVNDAGKTMGNHHRWRNDAVEHTQSVDNNMSAYSSGGNSHPTSAGNQKATAEFVPMLNHWVSVWQGEAPPITEEPSDPSVFIPAVIRSIR